jgi:hypothetical protein
MSGFRGKGLWTTTRPEIANSIAALIAPASIIFPLQVTNKEQAFGELARRAAEATDRRRLSSTRCFSGRSWTPLV